MTCAGPPAAAAAAEAAIARTFELEGCMADATGGCSMSSSCGRAACAWLTSIARRCASAPAASSRPSKLARRNDRSPLPEGKCRSNAGRSKRVNHSPRAADGAFD